MPLVCHGLPFSSSTFFVYSRGVPRISIGCSVQPNSCTDTCLGLQILLGASMPMKRTRNNRKPEFEGLVYITCHSCARHLMLAHFNASWRKTCGCIPTCGIVDTGAIFVHCIKVLPNACKRIQTQLKASRLQSLRVSLCGSHSHRCSLKQNAPLGSVRWNLRHLPWFTP